MVRVRSSPRWQKVLDDNADAAKGVLERIRVEGPLSSLDFERKSGTTKDWFGAPLNAVRAVLDAYTRIGVLGIAKRENNHRYYDLPERFLPAKSLRHERTLGEQLRHEMLSRYRPHGLLGASGQGEGIFDFLGPANPDPRYPGFPGRNAPREELVELGELIPTEVKGVSGKRYVVRDDVKLLQAPLDVPPCVAFLSLHDALVRDRKLLGKLFDFDYVSELYVPAYKRRWGWYVLPILFRDRFIGRIEPRIDAAKRTLQVLSLRWEDGFEPRKAEGFVEAMREALCAYLRFAKVDRIDWPSELGAEKRLFRAAQLPASR